MEDTDLTEARFSADASLTLALCGIYDPDLQNAFWNELAEIGETELARSDVDLLSAQVRELLRKHGVSRDMRIDEAMQLLGTFSARYLKRSEEGKIEPRMLVVAIAMVVVAAAVIYVIHTSDNIPGKD